MDKAKATKEQREILLQQSPLEIRKVDGEPTKIVGYAVRWDQLSLPIWGMFQERFKRGAFAATLVQPDIYASWQHDSREVLGRTPNTLAVYEDDIGLRYEITPPSWAEKYIETIERGDVRGSSFIFRAVKEDWDETNPDMAIRTINEAQLFEVSPVTTPAYPQSSVGVRSAEDVFNSRAEAVGAIEKRQQEIRRESDYRLINLKLIESEWC
jgi:HK97 family phage prohead protease